jgi:hypothetical protein
MKYKLNSLDEAVNIIIESSQKHAQATETGDYKIANKSYGSINNAVNYLKENDGIGKLKELLKYNEVSVKLWVASYLIKQDDPQAITVLKEIASQSIPHHSFNATLVLQGWQKGKV